MDVAIHDESVSTAPETAPAETAAPAEATEPTTGWSVPEEHSSAEWAKDIKSEADLYTKLGELHEKASAVTDPEKVLATLVPAEASEYALPEGAFEKEEEDSIRGILHTAGLTKAQAEKLITAHSEYEKQKTEAWFGKDGFEEEIQKSFGKDAEAPKAVAAALAKGLSDEDKKLLENMPNPVVGLVYRAVNNMIKSYGVREGGPAATSAPVALSPEARRAEASKIWAEIDTLQKAGKFSEARALRQKVDAMYKGA